MKVNNAWLQRRIFSESLILFLFSSFPAFAGDVPTDVLREKGMINKEDWIRIEADREKRPPVLPRRTKAKMGLRSRSGPKNVLGVQPKMAIGEHPSNGDSRDGLPTPNAGPPIPGRFYRQPREHIRTSASSNENRGTWI